MVLHRKRMLELVSCLSDMYKQESNYPYLKDVIQKGSRQDIVNLFPGLEQAFRISNYDLNDALINDSKEPLLKLVVTLKSLSNNKRFKTLYYHYNNFLNNKNKNRNKQKPINKNRIRLKNYLQCVAYSKNTSLRNVLVAMNLNCATVLKTILYQPKAKILNILQEIPFTKIHVSLNTIKEILLGSTQPQQALLDEISEQITNREDLHKYIYITMSLHNTSLKAVSKKLGHSENYINTSLNDGAGEVLANLFHEIAEYLNVPEVKLLAALARANVNKSHHAYLPRMDFITRYKYPMINYREKWRKHCIDHCRISRGFNCLDEWTHKNRTNLPTNIHIRKAVRQIIMGWSHIYGFSEEAFIKDNFNDFHSRTNPVKIIQCGQDMPIKHVLDWYPILTKMHHQFKTVKHSFNLTDVQQGRYGKYIYYKGVNLVKPLNPNTHKILAKLNMKKRYTFTAHFKETDIKTDKHTFTPVLTLIGVKHDNDLVSDTITFNYTKRFQELNHLETGDLLKFSARICKYQTGFISRNSIKTIAYTLYYPSNVKLVRRAHARITQPVPKEKTALIGYCIANNHSAAYDFSFDNYPYIRRCKINYKNWKRNQEISD